MRASAARPPLVAEMLGLDGTYAFPERLLQKIWLRGDFARERLVTTDGRAIRIEHPGRWNLLGGPDFLGAVLRFDGGKGGVRHGDIEVHLRAGDWDAHGHAGDPAYADVVLHVVLFPPPAGHDTRGAGGRIIPVLALLPWLHRGLEEFAADDAVERLADRPGLRLPEELARLPPAQAAAELAAAAAARWREKVRFAQLRIRSLGWTAACHHAALEILGYRFNRAPMLRLAGRWPLAEWAAGRVETARLLAAEAGHWSLQGVRPANQPRHRLAQYAAWVEARPDWPERLRGLGSMLPVVDPALSVVAARRAAEFTRLRARLADEIAGGQVGGHRLATLVCDGFLPLLAAEITPAAAAIWNGWEPGDLPAGLRAGMRQLGFGTTRERPFSNGLAQGLLGWLLAREPTR